MYICIYIPDTYCLHVYTSIDWALYISIIELVGPFCHVVAEDRLECASGFYFPVKDTLGGRSTFSKSLNVDTDLHVDRMGSFQCD